MRNLSSALACIMTHVWELREIENTANDPENHLFNCINSTVLRVSTHLT